MAMIMMMIVNDGWWWWIDDEILDNIVEIQIDDDRNIDWDNVIHTNIHFINTCTHMMV